MITITAYSSKFDGLITKHLITLTLRLDEYRRETVRDSRNSHEGTNTAECLSYQTKFGPLTIYTGSLQLIVYTNEALE